MSKYGPMSEEHKRKIGEANQGRVKSAEHKLALSVSGNRLGKYGITVEIYKQKLADGLRWCTGHKDFLPRDEFHQGTKSHCAECAKQAEFTRKHNLPFEWYTTKLKEQGGVCALCGALPTCRKHEHKPALYLDHDHACCPGYKSCGKCARGLLCGRCNFVLGVIENDPTLVDKLLGGIPVYLQRYRSI